MATFGDISAGGSSVAAPPSGDKAVSAFVLDRQGVLDHLLFKFTTQASACKAVIYDNTGVGGLPGAFVAASAQIAATGSGFIPFTFSSPPTLNAGTYWAGLIATTQGTASCVTLTNGIAFNANAVASPSNPFGASPSLANFRYPLVVFYTPVLTAGTYYGALLGGDTSHTYTANDLTLLKITVPVAGQITKLTTFLQATYASANCKGVVYSDNAGVPNVLLGSTPALNAPVINGNDLVFSSPVSISSGVYWIGLQTDTAMLTWHLADGSPNYITVASYAGGVPGTFPGGGATPGTGSWPLWATFAPATPIPRSRGVLIF